MPPKTLHLTNAYHPTSGGIGAFYRALMRHANERRREMRLIVPAEESSTEAAGEHVRIYHVKARPSPWIDARYRLMMPIGRSGREIKRILRAEQPDILEVADKYTLPFLSGIVRKGFVRGVRRPTEFGTSHERMDDNVRAYITPGAAGRALARLYMRFIYFPMFDHHIANSEYTAQELIPAARGHTTPRGVWVCPMGVDIDAFRFSEHAPHAPVRLLYAGRLAREKNVLMLADMLEQLPARFELWVAGDGPLRDEFAQRAEARAPGRVRMLGHLGGEALASLYRDCDVFVHANAREPFGIAPLEAMASGLPVVLPNAGGVLSYANPGNAWLAEPTPHAFARTVQWLLQADTERSRRLHAARAVAEQHAWPVVAARFLALCDDLHRFRLSGIAWNALTPVQTGWACSTRTSPDGCWSAVSQVP
ncbi:MAG TPA: glycosyltransferase, partial [Bryobacteraceae bacterium]|nr:glycosyltransferase [Bryobacteraceae bacterium]